MHSQGQGLKGFTNVTGVTQVLDATATLSDAASGLDFFPQHGSFQVHLTQKSTGQRVTANVNVDLDGIGAASALRGGRPPFSPRPSRSRAAYFRSDSEG